MKKKKAFTLAEVLITLGIIGIIAAMTLPTIIQKQQKLETSARLKKFYSSMNQAILMSESKNGSSIYWSLPNQNNVDADGNYNYAEMNKNAVWMLNEYILPYLKYLKVDNGKLPDDSSSGEYPTIYFVDGSTVQLYIGSCFDMIFDSNGDKKPNKSGKDQFRFYLCNTSGQLVFGNKFKTFGPAAMGGITSYTDRNTALAKCKNNADVCSVLLQKFDNWEFKDDYPW